MFLEGRWWSWFKMKPKITNIVFSTLNILSNILYILEYFETCSEYCLNILHIVWNISKTVLNILMFSKNLSNISSVFSTI